MHLDFSRDRILAVVAHPDDAELLCAGTLARAKTDGAEVAVCVMCQGDKGQPQVPIENLAEVRRKETEAAARVLGAELFLGEVPDSTLEDDATTRKTLIRILRTFRPTLMIAHAAEDYHVDHRSVSHLAEVCSWLCASHGQHVDEPPLENPPQLWWMDTIGMQQFEPGFYVDISNVVDVKERMLACHVSQIDRSGDSNFTPLLDLLHNQVHTRGHQAGVQAAEAFRCHHSFKRTRAW